jgi:heparan-alpha-glucosaminide N-acetyltransferase
MSDAGKTSTSTRLVSLDAYRGFIMLAMASAGFKLAEVARTDRFRADPAWQFLGRQTDHVAWRGCAFWDLIQPSFMFMVGVAMAYSYAARKARGESYGWMLGHAVYRSIVLVLLGVFLSSNWSSRTEWVFTNVLSQIGLGYTFLFLLWGRPAWIQWAAAAVLLAADWGLFYAWPVPSASFDFARVGLPADWARLQGLEAHWDKNTNVAAAVDREVLNWFPREKPFEFSEGGYATLNFIPSLATMIFGLLAGGLMRGGRSPVRKLLTLIGWGALFLAAGWALDRYGLCPLVKRIWTPSWALFSTGWTLWMLAGFYALVDMAGYKKIVWPLVVVGMNSIAIYCMSQLIRGWVDKTIERHFGAGIFIGYGSISPVYAPIIHTVLVLFVFWLICAWLFRQRIFVRI